MNKKRTAEPAVETTLPYIERKASEFAGESHCSSCPVKEECHMYFGECFDTFLACALAGIIDLDGNRIDKRQPQD